MAIILRWRYTPQVGAGDVTSLAAIVGPRGLGIASQSFNAETGVYTFTMTDGSTETVDLSGYTDSLEAIQTATEALRDQAQDYATAAGAAAGFFDFADLATLQADTSLTYTAGQDGTVTAGDIVKLRRENWSLEVLASGASGADFQNSNGTPVKFNRVADGVWAGIGKNDYIVVAGSLRNTAGTWAFLDDSGHSPLGADSVTVDGDEIVIDFTSLGATKVVSFVLAPDERFARDGIYAGASVGTTAARIRVGAPLNFWVNVDTQSVTTSTWWSGDISVAIASDYMEITHPSVDTDIFLNVDRIGSTTSRQIEMGQTRESTTKTRIYPRTDIYGYLSYNGTTWDETFLNTDFRSAISTSFTGGELVVTHPSNGGDYDLTLTGRQPYVALGDSFGSTSFQVQFWDISTGSQVTTEDTNMRFFFNRKNIKSINAGVIDIPVGAWSFKAPTAWLADPSKLTTSLANFWIYAVFEKDSTV